MNHFSPGKCVHAKSKWCKDETIMTNCWKWEVYSSTIEEDDSEEKASGYFGFNMPPLAEITKAKYGPEGLKHFGWDHGEGVGIGYGTRARIVVVDHVRASPCKNDVVRLLATVPDRVLAVA